jgi:hypothetical protein
MKVVMSNRTSKVSGAAKVSYTYNPNNNELTSNNGSYQELYFGGSGYVWGEHGEVQEHLHL